MDSDKIRIGRIFAASVVVFFLSLFALLLNGKTFSTGDSVPYRYLPQAIWEHHAFTLDMFPHLADPANYAIVRNMRGNLVSKKPVSPALFEIPVFLIFREIYKPLDEMRRILMGKLTMSILAAIACSVLFLCLLRDAGFPIAFISGLGLVLFTPFWFTAMDCWPHPLLALMNILSLYLFGKKGGKFLALIGFLQGIAITARLGSFPVFLVYAGFSFFAEKENKGKGWRNLACFAAGAAIPLILLGLYNHANFGSPFRSAFQGQAVGRIRAPFEGLAGFLFSPAKGLFLFSPILVFLPFAMIRNWKRGIQTRVATIAIIVHILFWSCYADWWGGWGFGARYLAEILPFAVFLTALFVNDALTQCGEKRRRLIFIALLVILIAFSVSFQAIGAFSWKGDYHIRYDKGWGEGRFWVWSAPFEPLWRLKNIL